MEVSGVVLDPDLTFLGVLDLEILLIGQTRLNVDS